MLSALLLALAAAQDPRPLPVLESVAVIDTKGPRAESVSIQAGTRRLALTHARKGTIELFDLSDPARPRAERVIELALAKGEELTSVALPPEGDWFLATVKAKEPLAAGRALAHSLADGALLATFPCGVGPDSIALSRDGRQALIADEAEGFDEVAGRLVSATGGLTRIELADDLARSRVTRIPFELASSGPLDGRRILREIEGQEREIELRNEAEYLEPEAVVFLPGEQRALVALQDNNLVAYVDLARGKLERLLPLGNATHPADLLDDGRFEESGTLVARREPDGLALTPDGRYFVTADEGNTEPDLAHPTAETPAAGGRTLSVFELASGTLQGDTGPELDRRAAAAGLYPDPRSPRKGSEPEMVLTFARGEVPYAAVTLERAGALALVDLSDPRKPAVVALAPTGADPSKDEPEGLAHFRDPSGEADYLYVANEGTSTLGVLRVLR